MPRGGHKVKAAPAPSTSASSSRASGFSLLGAKRILSNINESACIPTTALQIPNSAEARIDTSTSGPPSPNLPALRSTTVTSNPSPQNASLGQSNEIGTSSTTNLGGPGHVSSIPIYLNNADEYTSSTKSLPQILDGVKDTVEEQDETRLSVRPILSRELSTQSMGQEDQFETVLKTFPELSTEDSQSSTSSMSSKESTLLSSASSIYSSASSIYSTTSSMYSFDERKLDEVDGYAELCQREAETVVLESRIRAGSDSLSVRSSTRRNEAPKSALAKKAALYKNSRLNPELPSFTTSLATWAMVCRAAQASEDCYDSRSRVRKGTYTPADSSKDMKAMIVDDQIIDGSRVIICAIRGTQCQCLADWAVNKAATPAKPVGFLDDEDNACHEGFLQVTKAMVGAVAAQLQQQHSASLEQPSLLFTGHSAGGAVAAMLYHHMLSTAVHSDLTALACLFSHIDCVTFGAPPIFLQPASKSSSRSLSPAGFFLAFANEGDPITRMSNSTYLKSLGKLLTASLPAPPPGSTAAVAAAAAAAAAPAVKVVRGSQRSAVRRREAPVVVSVPWEEMPIWPTPAADLNNAGNVILLRDRPSGGTAGAPVVPEELSEVIFGDLAMHPMELYKRRVNELACAAIMGTEGS